ncbi:CAP domain-containing protein [Niabella soli]|uniref:Allergen V5/Tpx-1 family protein n=1 Tax=Niabella soli DSM 19437 TaxID=929713 RepID=W0EWR0_9BACT|nr:CAP domain-containing protein [Niabella soli]AHF15240.1 allergen V5/Tpx-1 family protein [Niabella soli DSM 19437]
MTRIPGFLFTIAFILLISSCAAPSRAQDNDNEPGFSSNALLGQINAIRAKGCNCGGVRYRAVPPVRWNTKLENAAVAQSNYMQRTNQLTHTGRNGTTPGKRITAAGYRWSYMAENVAMGQQNTTQVMQSWLQSPAHCKNIMSPYVSEIGAARSGRYWTLDLANPQ